MSVLEAARTCNLSKSSLSRHILAHRRSGAERLVCQALNAVNKVSSDTEGIAFVKYLITAAKWNSGLTVAETRQYQSRCSRACGKGLPPSLHAEKYQLRLSRVRNLPPEVTNQPVPSTSRVNEFQENPFGMWSEMINQPEPSTSIAVQEATVNSSS
ncbi:hypothetical protein ILUMI_13522, partial [Ignelater luminosus]